MQKYFPVEKMKEERVMALGLENTGRDSIFSE
jgi:hypothetical protein